MCFSLKQLVLMKQEYFSKKKRRRESKNVFKNKKKLIGFNIKKY